jgi:hypothetical protein
MALSEVASIEFRQLRMGSPRTAVTTAAILGPHDNEADVAPGVVRGRYASVSAVRNDHGDTLADGAEAAFQSGARRVFVASFGVDEHTNETVAETSNQGTLENSPILEVTTVMSDGDSMDIVYVEGDPHEMDPAEGVAYVNTKTGKVKTGEDGSGDLIVTYTTADTEALKAKLLMNPFAILTLADMPFSAQSLGIWDHWTNWALTNDKRIAYALESGVDPADVEDLVKEDRRHNVTRVAAHYTGDLNCAFAGMLSSYEVHGTMKEQAAPRGVTYTDTYTFDDFGAAVEPLESTWHDLGVNAVYRDFTGEFNISDDLSAEAAGHYKFQSTYSSEVFLKALLKDAVRAARRVSPTGLPYTNVGLQAIESVIFGVLSQAQADGILDEIGEVTMPDLDEIDGSDKQNRVLPNVGASVRYAGQIHFVSATITTSL